MDDIRLAMIGTALDFIETHLEDGVALADVARSAHYSKYHLHRAFSGILGITPHQYARRRRLTEAARRLVRFQTPLRDLALTAGYQSQQAFSDAFCAMYKNSAGGIPSPARFLSAPASHPPESRSPLIRHPSGAGRGYPGLDGASWSGGGWVSQAGRGRAPFLAQGSNREGRGPPPQQRRPGGRRGRFLPRYWHGRLSGRSSAVPRAGNIRAVAQGRATQAFFGA